MTKYDFVLFDADNTLFDFDQAEHLALGETLEGYGIPFTPEHEALYLRINRALWDAFDRGEISQDRLVVERFAAFLQQAGYPGRADPEEMNRAYLAALARQGCVLPGAEELCAALAPRCTLAIVTNGVSSAQRWRYDRSPIRHSVPHLFISQELGFRKPQREFFQRVFDALGIRDLRRTVVVGDSLAADIQGAVNAGVDSIWFNPKGCPALAAPVPTHTVSSFGEIRNLILG